MRFTARLVLAALSFAGLSFAAAQPAAAAALVVPIDQSTRLNIPGAVASVLVGNPAIADVTVIDSHTLYVLGRGYGATDLVVLDANGRQLLDDQLVVSSADTGRVSVYRGSIRSDMACAPNCNVAIHGGTTGGGGGGAAPSAPAAAQAPSPAGAFPQIAAATGAANAAPANNNPPPDTVVPPGAHR